MLRLSVTGVPDAWDSGGRLESSLIGLLLSRGRFGNGPFACVATLRFRQRRPLCGSATLAFATSFVGRVASARNRARIEMYLSACDCTGFCANLQKSEIIQLPLPSRCGRAPALQTIV